MRSDNPNIKRIEIKHMFECTCWNCKQPKEEKEQKEIKESEDKKDNTPNHTNAVAEQVDVRQMK